MKKVFALEEYLYGTFSSMLRLWNTNDIMSINVPQKLKVSHI